MDYSWIEINNSSKYCYHVEYVPNHCLLIATTGTGYATVGRVSLHEIHWKLMGQSEDRPGTGS